MSINTAAQVQVQFVQVDLEFLNKCLAREGPDTNYWSPSGLEPRDRSIQDIQITLASPF